MLEPGEARLDDAAFAAASLAVVELCSEQLGEVDAVGETVADRSLSERSGLLADGREPERPAGTVDGELCGLLGEERTHRAPPASSTS